jgi:hypothetical protein
MLLYDSGRYSMCDSVLLNSFIHCMDLIPDLWWQTRNLLPTAGVPTTLSLACKDAAADEWLEK